MRERIDVNEKNLLTNIMVERGSTYQKIANELGVSRQAARQIMLKSATSMRVSSLMKVSNVLGYHLELVKDD